MNDPVFAAVGQKPSLITSIDRNIPHPEYPDVVFKFTYIQHEYPDMTAEERMVLLDIGYETLQRFYSVCCDVAKFNIEEGQVIETPSVPEMLRPIANLERLPVRAGGNYITIYGKVSTLDGRTVNVTVNERMSAQEMMTGLINALFIYDSMTMLSATEPVLGMWKDFIVKVENNGNIYEGVDFNLYGRVFDRVWLPYEMFAHPYDPRKPVYNGKQTTQTAPAQPSAAPAASGRAVMDDAIELEDLPATKEGVPFSIKIGRISVQANQNDPQKLTVCFHGWKSGQLQKGRTVYFSVQDQDGKQHQNIGKIMAALQQLGVTLKVQADWDVNLTETPIRVLGKKCLTKSGTGNWFKYDGIVKA